ncbi:MAG TPA: TerC family protein [Candidatus Limnocylindria bacterium]
MEWASGILTIVLIDLVLSGDNAVVIGMAAHRLPPRQRRIAILVGGGAAILLRMTLTAIATYLLLVPGLRQVGGILLLWIGFKLLKEEEESDEGVKVAVSFRDAVITILIADFIMSLDNILGVAAAARGNVALLIGGLALSMAILMVGGSIVAELMNRVKWLTYVGAAAIAWTGAEMALRDSHGEAVLPLPEIALSALAVLATVGTISLAHYFHRRRPRRRRAREKAAEA